IAPLAAACAAPLRYHHCGVSPCGWLTAGTSTAKACGTLGAAVLAQAPSSRVDRAASRGVAWRMRSTIDHEQTAIMTIPKRHADDTQLFRTGIVPSPGLRYRAGP